MQSRKAINIFAIIIMFLISFGVASYFFYKYINSEVKKEVVQEPLSLLDSMAFKFSLNIDSLRNDTSFVKLLTKDLTEDDIYTKMLSYSDDDVVARFADTSKTALADTVQFFPTDSLRKIMALNDIKEEKLTEYVTNNMDRFNLLNEKKGLVKEVSTLQKQIDTISTKTEKIITGYKTKQDSLTMVAKQNAELVRQADEFKNQNFIELVRKYEAMKPVNAAEILADMPDEEVVKLLKKMSNRQAGKILAALPPSTAANLSLLIMKDKSDSKKPK